MLPKWFLDAMFWKINMAKDSRDNYFQLPFQGLVSNSLNLSYHLLHILYECLNDVVNIVQNLCPWVKL